MHSVSNLTAPCATPGLFSIKFLVIVSNALVKQCGLFMLLIWGKRAETTSSALSWFGLPACVTGEHSEVAKAANKRVIVWMYPLLVLGVSWPGGELFGSGVITGLCWTARSSKLWAVLSSWCRKCARQKLFCLQKNPVFRL